MAEKTSDDIFKLIKDENVEYVDIRFCDLPGVVQHFSIPASAFDESVFEDGLAFDELRYLTMFREDKVIHYLFEAGKADDKPRPRNEIEACRWIKASDVSKRRVRRPIKTLLKRCA